MGGVDEVEHPDSARWEDLNNNKKKEGGVPNLPHTGSLPFSSVDMDRCRLVSNFFESAHRIKVIVLGHHNLTFFL